jgi:phosphocarrier protein HPr/phosphocarrier protein
MFSKEVEIVNPSGFHVRPAQLFVELAAKFTADIKIQPQGGEMQIDGKSVLGLMTLGLAKGSVVQISATGADAEAAVEQLSALVASGFGEI